MKNLRQAKLIEIIGRENVETQEDLQVLLRKEGFEVTQATVSRDIKALRVYKTLSEKGAYRYALPSEQPDNVFSARLRTIFRESVTHIDNAQNLVIIKTLPGMASAACSALDAMNAPMVAGSLAGDDTAFIALRSDSAAKGLVEQLRSVLGE
ncbi:MAG: arginine repressor [Oscillospiraceae bacterium]|jgi:transcriptional regulator of arginine metabolism|nr:arginine repressor [Oscillospiraceae bacterium]